MKSIVCLLLLVAYANCQCSYKEENEGYKISWLYDENSQEVFFHLVHSRMKTHSYTGIAFGSRMHFGLDVMLVEVDGGGKVNVTDRNVHGWSYPKLDETQDIKVHDASFINGLLDVRFSRPIERQDLEEDKSLTSCQMFQFVTRPESIGWKHSLKPKRQMICGIEHFCTAGRPAQPDSSHCSYAKDDYSASWEFDPRTEMVNFHITKHNTDDNSYTGIGLGQSMRVALDLMLARVDNGFASIQDGAAVGYTKGENFMIDPEQNMTLVSASYEGRVLDVRFMKPMHRTDKYDQSLTGCKFFQHIYSGGPTDGKMISKHHKTPKTQQVCFLQFNCLASGAVWTPGTPGTLPPTTPTTTTVKTPRKCVSTDADWCEDYINRALKGNCEQVVRYEDVQQACCNTAKKIGCFD